MIQVVYNFIFGLQKMHRCNSSELFSPTNFAKFTDENPESNTSRVSSITARLVDHGVMFHLG